MRVVVDTNVLISGLLWRGAPHALLEQARAGAFVLLSSPALLEEFLRVLGRRKFTAILRHAAADPRRLQFQLRQLAEIVDPPPLPRRASRDPDDDHVLALAVAARADLIVSGDDDLLALRRYGRSRILAPAATLRLLAS